MWKKDKGDIFVISGPSGVGKTTVIKLFLKEVSAFNVHFSVSYTTRSKREGEINGKDYHFISKEEFLSKVHNSFFLEWAKVHGNYYGTGKDVLKFIERGQDVILDIDVQGALQVKNSFKQAITVFIFPPSLKELRNRLEVRRTESFEVIERRIEKAKDEINKAIEYDYAVINDDPFKTKDLIKAIFLDKILNGYKSRKSIITFVKSLLEEEL